MKKFSLLTLIVLLSGCAANVQTNSTQQGPKESAGAISGMIIGGALANDMAGDSRNKSLATVFTFVPLFFSQVPTARSVPRFVLVKPVYPGGALFWRGRDRLSTRSAPRTGASR